MRVSYCPWRYIISSWCPTSHHVCQVTDKKNKNSGSQKHIHPPGSVSVWGVSQRDKEQLRFPNPPHPPLTWGFFLGSKYSSPSCTPEETSLILPHLPLTSLLITICISSNSPTDQQSASLCTLLSSSARQVRLAASGGGSQHCSVSDSICRGFLLRQRRGGSLAEAINPNTSGISSQLQHLYTLALQQPPFWQQ